ncbi:DNA modification methylase [Ornithobacterium rhinotracheale]
MSKKLLAPLEWYTIKRKVKDLLPAEFSPRKYTDEDIAEMRRILEKFNLVEIPAIDYDGVILAGDIKIIALTVLGREEEEIDVRIPNRKLTSEEFKEYQVHSFISLGSWDFEAIKEHFQDLDLEHLHGFDFDEFSDFIADLDVELTESEEDFEPEPPLEPRSVIGDIYELFSKQKDLTHRVLCGDSTKAESYKELLKGDQFDLVVTDPPYNVNYEGGTKDKLKIQNDNMKDDEFFSFLFLFYQECFINAKLGAPIYVFHADSEGANFRNAFKQSGFKLSQCLVWVKNSIVMGRQDYHWKHEPILYGWKEGAAHSWYSDRKQSTVVEFDKPLKNAEHPTMKPIDLVSYFIKNSSKQKDLVFDGFLGSGSTLIASEQTWRNSAGIEYDPRYVDVIITRWVKYMISNNLEFEVKLNGKKLTQEELEQWIEK